MKYVAVYGRMIADCVSRTVKCFTTIGRYVFVSSNMATSPSLTRQVSEERILDVIVFVFYFTHMLLIWLLVIAVVGRMIIDC